MPCEQLFILERAFPPGVRAPVDRLLFERFASSRFSEIFFMTTRFFFRVSAMVESAWCSDVIALAGAVARSRSWGAGVAGAICPADTINMRHEIWVCKEMF
jgi:hypothetical protein